MAVALRFVLLLLVFFSLLLDLKWIRTLELLFLINVFRFVCLFLNLAFVPNTVLFFL